MAISDAARRNHEESFPGHVSTPARTDPELIIEGFEAQTDLAASTDFPPGH
jgi:hypothetical protein